MQGKIYVEYMCHWNMVAIWTFERPFLQCQSFFIGHSDIWPILIVEQNTTVF
jgi:hypothetical protein